MSRKSALQELADRNPQLAHAAESVEQRESRDKRISKARCNFPYFCEYYLPEYFTTPPARYQRILYDVIQARELTEEQATELKLLVPEDFRGTFRPAKNLRGIVDVEPRQHGKSTRMTFAYPLWCMLFKKANFILIIGASKDDAEAQMSNIREAIENNDRILDDFGSLASTPWNKSFLTLTNGTAVMAKGKGGSLRGRRNKQYRPDLIIVDDTLKDEESDSSRMREKVARWFSRTILPLGTEAMIVIVNTITNEDDLPSRILKDIKAGKKPGWIGLRFAAEVPSKKGGKSDTPLWPERYTWEDLKRIQEEIGSIAYAIEFLSRPLSDEDRIFKAAWIRRVKRSQLPEKLALYEGIDPATGAHDQSAVVLIGREKGSGSIYVISSNGKKQSTETFKRRVIDRYRLFRYRRAGMENVAFQEIYKKEIAAEAAKEGLHLPIRGMKPGRASKEARMIGISPLVENGLLQFGPGNEDLIDQLVGFPAAGYDDLCDALWYAIKVGETHGGGDGAVRSARKGRERLWRREARI